jgi:muramoyltetrapeptide carboxypeptidase LdcA involved in peptidoglycan recycling
VLEDVNEKIHRLVRYLYLMENKGYLRNCRAMILGDFIGTEKVELFYNEVKNMAEKYGFWVIREFPFGHHLHSVSLPFGVKAVLDMKKRQIRWDKFRS